MATRDTQPDLNTLVNCSEVRRIQTESGMELSRSFGGEDGQDYELRERIGAGGQGEVWTAHERGTDRLVAVKLVTKAPSQLTADDWARVRREIQTTAKLSHPNIVKVFGCGKLPEGTPYIILEHLQGDTLATALKTAGRLPVFVALKYVADIAAALQAAAKYRVVHRDLKPANVILVDDGAGDLRAVVIDWGIAKVSHLLGPVAVPLTKEGQTRGTPQYMSPEQIYGEEPTPASDLYALGCILYELLTGCRPYQGIDDDLDHFGHLGVRKYIPPSIRCPEANIPQQVDALVQDLMSKKWTQRAGLQHASREPHELSREVARRCSKLQRKFADGRDDEAGPISGDDGQTTVAPVQVDTPTTISVSAARAKLQPVPSPLAGEPQAASALDRDAQSPPAAAVTGWVAIGVLALGVAVVLNSGANTPGQSGSPVPVTENRLQNGMPDSGPTSSLEPPTRDANGNPATDIGIASSTALDPQPGNPGPPASPATSLFGLCHSSISGGDVSQVQFCPAVTHDAGTGGEEVPSESL